jgi:hypothetical protein
MNYIDNSTLFTSLPEMQHYSKSAKVCIIILSITTVGLGIWVGVDQMKLKQAKAKGDNK